MREEQVAEGRQARIVRHVYRVQLRPHYHRRSGGGTRHSTAANQLHWRNDRPSTAHSSARGFGSRSRLLRSSSGSFDGFAVTWPCPATTTTQPTPVRPEGKDQDERLCLQADGRPPEKGRPATQIVEARSQGTMDPEAEADRRRTSPARGLDLQERLPPEGVTGNSSDATGASAPPNLYPPDPG